MLFAFSLLFGFTVLHPSFAATPGNFSLENVCKQSLVYWMVTGGGGLDPPVVAKPGLSASIAKSVGRENFTVAIALDGPDDSYENAMGSGQLELLHFITSAAYPRDPTVNYYIDRTFGAPAYSGSGLTIIMPSNNEEGSAPMCGNCNSVELGGSATSKISQMGNCNATCHFTAYFCVEGA